MPLSNLLKNLEKSEAFKDFRKENKDAFLCAAFLIMNIKQGNSENSLDFRDNRTIFSFKLAEKEVILQKEEIISNQKPLERIDEKNLGKLKTDAEDLQKIVEKEMTANKITGSLDEIIAVLQSEEDGKALVWALTCICESFTILSIKIDALSGKILKFEKKNLLDFVSVKKPEKK